MFAGHLLGKTNFYIYLVVALDLAGKDTTYRSDNIKFELTVSPQKKNLERKETAFSVYERLQRNKLKQLCLSVCSYAVILRNENERYELKLRKRTGEAIEIHILPQQNIGMNGSKLYVI